MMRNPLDKHTREGATHAKEHNKPERSGNKCERDLGWSHENVKAKNVDEHRAEQPIWSLSNAFTSGFKELDPIPQFKATAKLGEFIETRFSQSF